ncbi:hypothetical protein K0M31_005778 [Melipona bicolor]|uniref:Uncharacterized protein n=1 Tax=Melipona bicolor TaxID=60889 RepID=A0AA40FUM0_9HYME|nr:hypothetical protein K0M31_005778 [Melipona bicolor]
MKVLIQNVFFILSTLPHNHKSDSIPTSLPIFLQSGKCLELLNKKKPRTEFFPRLNHYPKCSFRKDILFLVSKDTGDQGDEFTGGLFALWSTRARYNKTIPVATHETDAESSQTRWEKWGADISWDINAGRVFLWTVAGYVDSITTLPIPRAFSWFEYQTDLSSTVLECPDVFDRDTNPRSPFLVSSLVTMHLIYTTIMLRLQWSSSV